MKKIIKYLFVFLILFNILTISVDALPVYLLDTNGNCNSVLGSVQDPESVAYLLQQIFSVIKFITPVMVLGFCSMDFIKATASQDKDLLQKAIKTSITRLIVGLIVFMLPVLINFVFDLLGWYGTCGVK